jgi:hypothetical protein
LFVDPESDGFSSRLLERDFSSEPPLSHRLIAGLVMGAAAATVSRANQLPVQAQIGSIESAVECNSLNGPSTSARAIPRHLRLMRRNLPRSSDAFKHH